MNKLRKIFFISLSFLLLFLPTISFFEISDCIIKNYVGASELSHIKYAKAKDNCYLFRSSDVTNSNYGNVFFMVPKTYFVTILNKINSYIYKVQYKNKIGYVSSDSVAEVTFIPEKATLEGVVFDTLDMVGTQIRTVPNAEDLSNIIMIIPAGSTGLNYISYIHGGVPSGGNSDVWYYALYQPMSDPTSVYEGYVYSEKTKNLTAFEDNSEGVPENTGRNESDIGEGQESEYSQINDNVKIVLIIIICIPVLIIFILLVVGGKTKNKDLDKGSEKNIIDQKSSSDRDETSYKPKHRSVKSLKGKTFKEKTSVSMISKEVKTDSIKPVFPTYEVIDDDDLL